MVNPDFRRDAQELLRVCRAKDVGTMVIKSITKGPWGEKQPTANTWYEPFSQMEEIQAAVNFVLSQDVTGICTAGDTGILPMVLKACENFTPLTAAERETMIERGAQFEPLFK